MTATTKAGSTTKRAKDQAAVKRMAQASLADEKIVKWLMPLAKLVTRGPNKTRRKK